MDEAPQQAVAHLQDGDNPSGSIICTQRLIRWSAPPYSGLVRIPDLFYIVPDTEKRCAALRGIWKKDGECGVQFT
jgi:hypothetical protein